MSKITSKKSKDMGLSVEEQESALRQVHQTDRTKNIQRFTIDLPVFIYDQMKAETEMTGQTLKGFVLGLVREHFARKADRE